MTHRSTRLVGPVRAGALHVALVLGDSATAFAQDPAGAAPASDPADYRWAIYTSCTIAFAVIIFYLVLTHVRSRAVAENVEAIERRLDELEKQAK